MEPALIPPAPDTGSRPEKSDPVGGGHAFAQLAPNSPLTATQTFGIDSPIWRGPAHRGIAIAARSVRNRCELTRTGRLRSFGAPNLEVLGCRSEFQLFTHLIQRKGKQGLPVGRR